MSVSRVRENRMHGLTGGGWKRGNLRHRASPLPSHLQTIRHWVVFGVGFSIL